MSEYDSVADTLAHISKVQNLLSSVIKLIGERSQSHDASKLKSPEKEMYDEFTPKLRGQTYGSSEYKQNLEKMGEALQHHYEHNSHHPEHFADGINDMSLLDLIEMLADWTAAVTRHADGDLMDSIRINEKRFDISEQLVKILKNTVAEMRWYRTD